MGVDVDAVGTRAEPYSRSWSEHDALLYAVGVGAGQSDPTAELPFTTENSTGVPQQVLPTFAVPLLQNGLGKRLPFGAHQRGALVHAEQTLLLHQLPPTSGTMVVNARITGIYDKRSGALVRMETTGVDQFTGKALVTTRLGYFIRGCGGFGGPPTPDEAWPSPEDAEPDVVIHTPTRPDQALLYRLSGDRNPLHSDPNFAKAAGFDGPILHGLCTYGVVARELIRVLCDGDPSRLSTYSSRFSRPVYPGQTLVTSVWLDGCRALFRTATDSGTVLDRGTLALRPSTVITPKPDGFALSDSSKETHA
ncbi:MaoC/PaaZ C-terminal domain-containing protein [Mycolicibacterium sp. P9-22]|uniref:MaoC/PaaZ C-terminal domain-containing protein n=1 Tax=Mycolicibacterium sp. P9-22 TaxID=2024613 RepID=UPI0011EE788A|nr:MaoC/PaaZ C-terminal domain-containing protein [Mycolicibacterium sp. P9-22]KAA0120613.1 hypothetical protein CIW51_03905 [Mycolicibacterium sp. P9-22]